MYLFCTGVGRGAVMNRGGRPIDLVWQHFHKVEKDGKQYSKCKNCGNIRASCVDRMKSHVEQCLQEKPNLEEISEMSEIESVACASSATAGAKKVKLDHKLDLLVAKFFYANNIPFNVVEHRTFQDLISAL